MDGDRSAVKLPRPYDSSGRRRRAGETRENILRVAEQLLRADGYARTSIAGVAAGAGVSVETVYKAFGGKPGLVRAIRDTALAGEGPLHAETRSDALRAAERDPRAMLRGFLNFVERSDDRRRLARLGDEAPRA